MTASAYGFLGAGLLAAYVFGSIPWGLLVARARGIDIRRVGSGNIGATNVFRCVGKGWGLLAFALDFLKGLLPVLLLPRLLPPTPAGLWVGLLCGCAAIAGHNWPVFLKFRGGKGIATSAGVLAGVAPAALLAGLGAWMVLLLLTRYVSLASIGAAAAVAVAAWIRYTGPRLPLAVGLTLLAALAIFKHRGNLRRLRAGTELRFSFARKQA